MDSGLLYGASVGFRHLEIGSRFRRTSGTSVGWRYTIH
jgi:hypothetical protein